MPETDSFEAPPVSSSAGSAVAGERCDSEDADLSGIPAAVEGPAASAGLRKGRRLAFLVAVAAALLLTGAITAGSLATTHPGIMQNVTRPAVATSSSQPLPEELKTAAPQAQSRGVVPLRLLYPGANADVVVDPLTLTAAELATGEVDPPRTTDAYWLTNYGRPGPGSADTTFIISHRWIGQDAPFNRIGAIAKPGDRFTLNGVLDFTVSEVNTFDKATLNTAPIWRPVPGRLVMITCDFNDPWGKNTVITADPTPHQP